MHASSLDRRVQIMQQTGRDAVYGGDVDTWTLFATVWCNVHELSARQILQSAEVAAIQQKVLTMRYVPGLLPAMRFILDGNPMRIVGISVRGRRAWHVVQCEQVNVGAPL